MLSGTTKTQILASRYAYDTNELVLVNALDLCDDIIDAERMQRAYAQLSKAYELLKIKYELKCLDAVEYRRINLRG